MSFEKGYEYQETIALRNQRIRADLDSGMLPVLAFEITSMKRQLADIMSEQDEMGRELAEVNHQGSETWHDNFAANNIEWHSKVVARRGGNLTETLHRSVELDLPPKGSEVTLGSLLTVRFPGSDEPEYAFVTGTAREMEDSSGLDLPEEFVFITLQSPIGQALLGARAGEVVSYQVNGSQKAVQVVSVSQVKPS